MNAGEPKRRFVLLRHELPEGSGRASHFDLMLERDDDLFTLELSEPLSAWKPLAARELAAHRKAYLDYEGPVSGGRGSVTRVDRGELTVVLWRTDRIELDLEGRRLRGRLALERERDSGGEDGNWRATLFPEE